MGDLIKELSTYSSEVLCTAVNAIFSNEEERNQFEISLQKIVDIVDRPAKKKKVDKVNVPSMKEIFNAQILPTIRRNLENYEENADKAQRKQVWKLDLTFVKTMEQYHELDLTDCNKIHDIVNRQEKCADNIQLALAFYRGLIYIRARQFAPDVNAKDWFKSTFNQGYTTILRYQAFAKLVKTYPRMLVVGLKFTLIDHHWKNIVQLMNTDKELAQRMKMRVDVCVQNQMITILSIEEVEIDLSNRPKQPSRPGVLIDCDEWYPDIDQYEDGSEFHQALVAESKAQKDDEDVEQDAINKEKRGNNSIAPSSQKKTDVSLGASKKKTRKNQQPKNRANSSLTVERALEQHFENMKVDPL